LCTMGRICHQKGFDILMDLFAGVRAQRKDIHLYLLGDGPDRAALENQIKTLGLEDAVTLLGNQPNPFPYLDQMDGFVLTSRYEGQGLVLWEARTLGLELFMAEHLAKYNPGLTGTKDIAAALIAARRKEKVRDDLRDYNDAITESLNRVLELDV
ncbi:MAG: glycosyltransferase, partial [Eubacteriales bacterium]|nr:glycosyltransferase [Eubacteriales bacterium]